MNKVRKDVVKVTDPSKIVTDPTLLLQLEKRGINKDFVELYQDYAPHSLGKEHSPYAKFYRDLISNKRFMVVSQLPMVKVKGHKIEPAWYYSEKHGVWYSRANLFSSIVSGRQVDVTCLSNQPYGVKAGDKVTFKPQVFLDGVEVHPVSEQPDWLEIDSDNENYHQNVLEWDYGVCKRRLRIIESRLLGYWLFPQKPSGAVRIKYSQVGSLKLRLGRFKVNDEELITLNDFDELAKHQDYPIRINDSMTFYPDAHPETNSVDGATWRGVAAGASWTTLKAGDGTGAGDDHWAYGYGGTRWDTHTTSNLYKNMYRSIYLFATNLPEAAIITGAVLSIFGYGKADPNDNNPSGCVYSSNPTSNTQLVAGDFTSLGVVAFSDTITYAAWSIAGYNPYTLNDLGIAAIPINGIAKFGTRDPNYDVGSSVPTWGSGTDNYIQGYCSEQGEGYQPKLVVTYTVGGIEINAISTNVISEINGIPLVEIEQVNGVTVVES